jgi:hypothetical protein
VSFVLRRGVRCVSFVGRAVNRGRVRSARLR